MVTEVAAGMEIWMLVGINQVAMRCDSHANPATHRVSPHLPFKRVALSGLRPTGDRRVESWWFPTDLTGARPHAGPVDLLRHSISEWHCDRSPIYFGLPI